MVELLFRWVEDFRRASLVHLAFGEPRSEHGRIVIPVASVSLRRLAVVGADGSRDGMSLPDPADGATSRPLALLTVGDDGVRLRPARSQLAMSALAGLAAGLGTALGWWLARGRRS